MARWPGPGRLGKDEMDSETTTGGSAPAGDGPENRVDDATKGFSDTGVDDRLTLAIEGGAFYAPY